MSSGVTSLPCNPYGARQPVFECESGCGHYSESTTAFNALVSGLAQASTTASEVDVSIKPSELVDMSGGFYSYAGSLTTPTCNPVVTWVVMSKVMKIPRSALDLFQDKTVDSEGHKVTRSNFRPLQARGGRSVFVSKEVTTLTCNPEGAREPHFPCDDDCVAVAHTRAIAPTDAAEAAVAARRSTGGGWTWDRCDSAQGPAHWPSNDGAFCNAEE
eukprot:2589997-Rhodomonas_salina.1